MPTYFNSLIQIYRVDSFSHACACTLLEHVYLFISRYTAPILSLIIPFPGKSKGNTQAQEGEFSEIFTCLVFHKISVKVVRNSLVAAGPVRCISAHNSFLLCMLFIESTLSRKLISSFPYMLVMQCFYDW